MLWSFIAVCLSAWLSGDASYRGPTWQRWVFKPLTLLLRLFLAWQAPMCDASSELVLAGLCASLLGDALTLVPRQRLRDAIGAFFLSRLLYTIYFASQMTLSFFWPLPLVLLVLGALLLAIIWTRLEEYRWPICTVATSTSDVRHRRVFPLAPAVHHLFRPSDDALILLASATGAAGSGRAVTGDYLDASVRVSLAYLHVYRHDAGDGVAGR